MDETFVIKVNYGGLGDHLFHSHLPRIAKQHAGYRQVLVSTLSRFRSPDYRRLVWETNPYVDGFADLDAPTPDLPGMGPGANILDSIMVSRGLDDGKRFHDPELYFQPAKDNSLSNAIVYDPNFVSYVGQLKSNHVERFFASQCIEPDIMLLPRGKGAPVRQYRALLETLSLEHYCSVIVSAKKFICLTSGGATLAAALGISSLALWGHGQQSAFHHSRLHTYVNVNPSVLDRRFPAVSRSSERIQGSLKRIAKRFLAQVTSTPPPMP